MASERKADDVLRRMAAVLLGVAMVAGACGDDDGGLVSTTAGPVTTAGGGTTATTPSTVGGGCTVEVTGDATATWTGPNDLSAFTSDYWYTEDELEQQFGMFGDPTEGTFDETLAAGGQIFTFFLFNCSGPNGELVNLTVSADATRADFPFGPGTYAITGGMFSGDEMGADEFSMLFAMNDTDVWGLDGAGTVTIAEWNGSRLAGSFTFNARESFVDTPRHLAVTGSFEVTCQASVQC
ncbi:MAG: hypothetical protein HZA58_08715 [Acidimicrobiia bacterium]|nr:hypothetical protein [Acidimicrobiia bacterium]